MRVVNKKYIILTTILLILVISGGLIFGLASGKETAKLEEVQLKGNDNKSNMFAIMIGQTDGTYKESAESTWPLKEDGYVFNQTKSGCIDANGNTIEDNVFNYRNNMIKLKVKQASFCYLYFDIISEGDYCINQGITDLGDCLLVMEDYSYDTEEAIEYITNKGSATTSATAPTVTYKEKSENVTGTVLSTTANYSLGSTYSFNETTGMYTLKGTVKTTTLSDDYLNYYTCGGTTSGWTSCATMYQVKAYTKTVGTSSTTYKVTEAVKYTYNAVDSFDSEVGLYKTTDADGDTYFYRGAVKNNYVSYGGFIWRIVRINGNGTIRMIYSGTSTSATGSATSIGTSAYNSKYWDPTYVGYTYDDSNMVYRENTTLTTYSNMTSTAKYYYGKEISCNATTKKCTLSGDTMNGVWSEKYQEVLDGGYIYTCFSTSVDGTCNFAFKLNSYVNSNSAKGYYISYNSPDYATTLKDTTDSTIKDKIDTWYENNIKDKTDSNGNLLSSYLSDEVFCNDRQFYSGSGHLMSPTTYYNAYNRIANQFKPSLLCGQDSDKFSVANGNLDYPIALLTIDEASFAGGRLSYVNNQYYLYTGQSYWTMSPSYFDAGYAIAYVWRVYSAGYLNAYYVTYAYGVRPVINLSSDVLISQGTGTADNPYVVTLASS